MYTKRNYGFWMTFNWSKKPFLFGVLYTALISILYRLLKVHYDIDISVPWQPVSTLGIAVAFYLGFKNNASYDRTWEARKIWGAIVNNSRSFGAAVMSFIQGPDKERIQKELIYRHLGWLTALRYQLRLAREWEHTDERINNALYIPSICESYYHAIDKELGNWLTNEEVTSLEKASNKATQILKRQTQRLEEIFNNNQVDLFKQLEIQKYIASFYEEQGKSERIKNFPFPRQYASTALWMTFIFSALIPFGMLDIMSAIHTNKFWLIIPLSGMTIWIFFLMEMIGDYSENPFEGSYNDIPISAIARSVEIDLREMAGDKDIPAPLQPDENGFLM